MVNITLTRRNRYRGYVQDEKGLTLLQTSTSYETRQEVWDVLRDGAAVILTESLNEGPHAKDPSGPWWKFW